MRRMQGVSLWCAASLLALATPLLGQGASAKPLTYEIASVKRNNSGDGMVSVRNTANGYSAKGVTVMNFIQEAFDVKMEDQIAGVPGSIVRVRFDIEAKMDGETAATLKKLPAEEAWAKRRPMMQALLEDRFKLKMHRESRDLPIYSLVVAKGGFKLKEADPNDTYADGIKGPDGSSHPGMMMMGPGMFEGQAIPMYTLVPSLMNQVGRVIVDNTGLKGKYDIKLEWSTEEERTSSAGDNGLPASTKPSLFTALQEQLGLKLEPAKGPVDTIVVDHIEMPSEN